MFKEYLPQILIGVVSTVVGSAIVYYMLEKPVKYGTLKK